MPPSIVHRFLARSRKRGGDTEMAHGHCLLTAAARLLRVPARCICALRPPCAPSRRSVPIARSIAGKYRRDASEYQVREMRLGAPGRGQSKETCSGRVRRRGRRLQ